jgi:hypothetical protein
MAIMAMYANWYLLMADGCMLHVFLTLPLYYAHAAHTAQVIHHAHTQYCTCIV